MRVATLCIETEAELHDAGGTLTAEATAAPNVCDAPSEVAHQRPTDRAPVDRSNLERGVLNDASGTPGSGFDVRARSDDRRGVVDTIFETLPSVANEAQAPPLCRSLEGAVEGDSTADARAHATSLGRDAARFAQLTGSGRGRGLSPGDERDEHQGR